jgi:hypothetical protein
MAEWMTAIIIICKSLLNGSYVGRKPQQQSW